ncbi:hypothetical protein Spla01_03701 [Streptomyces platensis]|uniref:Uncharacterized protein n=1 Tax=Streptomyces platensis TaxID=58346 RepID=A0ABX3XMV7_STRPT|nr:hypothetical protein BG653_06930 [Streptomyces platensis]
MQALGQHTVPQGHDHLDDTGRARRGLAVPDIRLDRPQPQGPVLGAVLAVRGQQRLGLDRVAERRAGAVRLHRVDLAGRYARVGECLVDDALLRGAVRGGQAVGRTVLVHRRTPHHRKDRVTVALGVRQPLDQQDSGAFAEHGAVGAGAERPDLTAACQVLLAAEVDEGDGGGHHGDAAGQCHRAFAGAQRLDRQMQGDQRGGTGGVHGYGGAFEAEQIGDPAGENAAVGTAAEKGGHFLGYSGDSGAVVVVHDAGEHTGFAPFQRKGVDSGAFDGFPGDLQHQPLLWVHGQRFAR